MSRPTYILTACVSLTRASDLVGEGGGLHEDMEHGTKYVVAYRLTCVFLFADWVFCTVVLYCMPQPLMY